MIKININKAKVIAHEKRRAKRTEEFAPLDEVIAKQIPGKSAQQAESERQQIRDKYALIQKQIDDATDIDSLKSILNNM